MPRVFKRAAARRELVEHYVYLEEQAGEALAERFLANAESSFGAAPCTTGVILTSLMLGRHFSALQGGNAPQRS
jgi:hypothetical protein